MRVRITNARLPACLSAWLPTFSLSGLVNFLYKLTIFSYNVHLEESRVLVVLLQDFVVD